MQSCVLKPEALCLGLTHGDGRVFFTYNYSLFSEDFFNCLLRTNRGENNENYNNNNNTTYIFFRQNQSFES